MKDVEMYETICKDRFDGIEATQKEMLGLLRGFNGTPGILEELRGIKRGHKMVTGAIGFVGCAMALQLIESIWGWLSGLV